MPPGLISRHVPVPAQAPGAPATKEEPTSPSRQPAHPFLLCSREQFQVPPAERSLLPPCPLSHPLLFLQINLDIPCSTATCSLIHADARALGGTCDVSLISLSAAVAWRCALRSASG